MNWLSGNWDTLWTYTREHVWLALVPVVAGLLIAVPLGWLASRSRHARAVLLALSNILYTVPSIALIVVAPAVLGTRILDPLNVIVPLTIYTVALLIRGIADALAAVPGHVVAAATAMGFRPLRRFLTVEFPLAVPVTIAGLRVATVSNISLVSVGALVGISGYGQLFTEGFQENFPTKIVVGVVATLVLAFLADSVLLLAGRVLTPWARAGR